MIKNPFQINNSDQEVSFHWFHINFYLTDEYKATKSNYASLNICGIYEYV